MRLIFAGTPEFAERSLARILGTTHTVALVLTQPDRPAGRGLRVAPSAVKALAATHDLRVLQPAKLDIGAIAALSAVQADAVVVAAYGLILPPAALEVARHGAINIHASLLPRWRGAAPIQRALLAGDAETGISIMQMDAGLDTGPVYVQRRLPVRAHDDAGTLHERLAELGAETLLAVLDDIAAGRARATPQPAAGVTYARKIDKAETFLDWTRPAQELERAVRAFRPAPGAGARLEGEMLKIWRASVVAGAGAPGHVLTTGGDLYVACGADALSIEELQPAGKRRMRAGEFLRGHPLKTGARFE